MGLVFLAALAMLAWRTADGIRQVQERIAALRSEASALHAVFRGDDPALRRAIIHERDDVPPLEAMRDRALARFDELRTRYGAIEARGGDVVSIRTVPAIADGPGPAPVIFRLVVPPDRPVWLKFGTHLAGTTVEPPQRLDEGAGLRSDTPLAASGPYEARLSAGDHTLTIAVGTAAEGSLPLAISLGDGFLLQSSFDSPGVSGVSSSHTSPVDQYDIRPPAELPWLMTGRLNHRDSKAEQVPAFSLWLSDQASGFAEFPGH
jgi:hypothetical protein